MHVHWVVACLISNVAIMAVEYINRVTPGGWHHAIPKTVLLIIVAQWALYTAWSQAPHWFSAWIVFSLGNTVMRIVAVHLGASDEVGSWPYVLAGIALMVCGSLIVKMGLR